jgi:hypothetical protein
MGRAVTVARISVAGDNNVAVIGVRMEHKHGFSPAPDPDGMAWAVR